MIFDELLTGISSRLKTARAALLLDADGISVAEWKRPGETLDAVSTSIEYSRLLQEGMRIAGELGDGALQELALKLEKGTVFFAPVRDGYSVVLILDSDQEIGLARYLTRRARPEIAKEL